MLFFKNHKKFKKITYSLGLLLVLSLLFVSPVKSEDLNDEEFAVLLKQLTQKKFRKKQVAIENLQAVSHPKLKAVYQALLGSKLFYIKKTKQVVYAEKSEAGYVISNVFSNESLGEVSKRKVQKISINNKIRTAIRASLASLSLSDPDSNVRLLAVQDMMKDMSDLASSALKARLSIEQNEDVKEAIEIALALLTLNSEIKQVKLDSIKKLSKSLNPIVKSSISKLLEKNANGEYVEDEDVRLAAKKALDTITTGLKFYGFVETLFFGLSLGSVLLLSAIGLAITFGVMGVINMAHGELMMLGAYTTYVIQLLMPNSIEYSLLVAIPVAFLVSGFVGILIERGCLKYLYGRPLETLLATFGISLILQQTVRTIFTPLNRAVETPEWMSGAWQINEALSITYNRFYVIIFSLIVFTILLLILKRTSLGLHIRAVSQNRSMAKAMGVRSEWVDALTFGLGSGIAGVAGVALSQLTNVGPNLGQAYIIDSFMVVVFGGVGNLWGTFVGAMSLGVVNKFLEPWSGAVLAKIIVLVFIILFIQKRPRGLFPQKGRAAEH